MEVANIYDNGPVSPICQIKENLSIYTAGGVWKHFNVLFIDGLAPGSGMVVDMVATAPAAVTSLAANGTINKQIVNILQPSDNEFIHCRFEPLDNVEGAVWETAGQPKGYATNIHARVDRMTRQFDPWLTTTTFWVLGTNRDMNLETRNPMGYATPTARFMFWGYRYMLEPIDIKQSDKQTQTLLAQGDRETVKRVMVNTRWVPGEGRY